MIEPGPRDGVVRRAFSTSKSPLGGGYVLTLNSLVGAALGFAFWIVAAQRFAPSDIGFASATVAGAALISGIGTDGLHNTFLRFVPRAGDGWPAIVVRGYTVASVTTAVLGSLFILAASRLDSALGQLGTAGWILLFVAGAPIWTIFSLQDVVLIARRHARLVLIEDTAVSLARIVLLFTGVLGDGAQGIFLAWLLPAILAVILISPYLARSSRSSSGRWPSLRARSAGRDMLRYYAGATVGSIATILQISAIPVIVAAARGVSTNARFYLPWAIGTSLQLVSSSMASPLAAEIARGIKDERQQVMRVLSHCTTAIAAVAVPLYFLVPPVLGHLGDSYRVEKPLFALLLVAALVNAVPSVYLARARARGDVTGAALAQWAAAVVLLVGSAVLLPTVGLVGVGLAAVTAQCAAAAIAFVRDASDEAEGGETVVRTGAGTI